MTPAEFVERMRVIAEKGDKECQHSEADKLLCEMLLQLDYGQGVIVYDSMKVWYA